MSSPLIFDETVIKARAWLFRHLSTECTDFFISPKKTLFSEINLRLLRQICFFLSKLA